MNKMMQVLMPKEHKLDFKSRQKSLLIALLDKGFKGNTQMVYTEEPNSTCKTCKLFGREMMHQYRFRELVIVC